MKSHRLLVVFLLFLFVAVGCEMKTTDVKPDEGATEKSDATDAKGDAGVKADATGEAKADAGVKADATEAVKADAGK
jgi:hypothetical protein